MHCLECPNTGILLRVRVVRARWPLQLKLEMAVRAQADRLQITENGGGGKGNSKKVEKADESSEDSELEGSTSKPHYSK